MIPNAPYFFCLWKIVQNSSKLNMSDQKMLLPWKFQNCFLSRLETLSEHYTFGCIFPLDIGFFKFSNCKLWGWWKILCQDVLFINIDNFQKVFLLVQKAFRRFSQTQYFLSWHVPFWAVLDDFSKTEKIWLGRNQKILDNFF